MKNAKYKMKKCTLYFVPCILFLGSYFLPLASIRAQSILFPPDYFFDVARQKAIFTDTTTMVHSSMQPIIYKDVPPDTLKHIKPGQDLFFDKVFYDDLLKVKYIDKSSGKNRKFNLAINPVFNFSFGKDADAVKKETYITNTRGVWIKGQIGEKFIFETSFFENQSNFPTYLAAYCNTYSVVPGQGRWKAFKKDGFDYAMSNGVVHYQPGKKFSVRLGTGKQKVGVGYRSILLSDNGFNYPYLQFTASFFKQKVQYTQTYALLMNLSDGGTRIPYGTERIFQKKAASFQQLSWQVNKKINIYLFQGLIWRATDSNNVMHLNALYVNPVIFTNLAAYGFNNSNHIIEGGGWEMKPFKKTSFYGQFMYDGSYLGKANLGVQAGLKLFDALHIKNLYLQGEYNYVSQHAYQDYNNPAQSYTQYNQLLTTPAAFSNEMVGLASYTYKKLFIQVKENYSFGNNMSAQNLSYFDAKFGYMINPSYKANIAIGTTFRTYENTLLPSNPQQMQLFYISFKTSLYNIYYDF
ncbi:MAG: hypothetical protein ABI388_11205 [Bacteroidia bacterium]